MSTMDTNEHHDGEPPASRLSPLALKRSASYVRVGPVDDKEVAAAGVPLNKNTNDLERGTTTSFSKEKEATSCCTRRRFFLASLVVIVLIVGVLIGVLVSRGDDDTGQQAASSTFSGTPKASDDCGCEEGSFCWYPEGDCGTGGANGECIVKPEYCTLDYTPVCGCDGVTYGNECGAMSAGVSIDYRGECDEPPADDCADNCNSEEGSFCWYPEGDCGTGGGKGECMIKPEYCTADYTPVCGCDGVTHGNECGAMSAGVSIEYRGECTRDDDPPTDCSDCDEETHFCQYETGDCGASGDGQCIMKPEMCTADYTPVCGCDGVTYGNACGAESAGVNIEKEGECDEPPTDCSDCNEETHFCQYETGVCDASGDGQCVMKPEDCTDDYNPVCGCDGVTYGNACNAEAAGVTIQHEGECDESPTNDCTDCDDETHFCQYEVGDCADSGEGQCVLKPEMCTADYTPVCGCDGVTYGNSCGAESAGVNIEKEGECDESPTVACPDCDEETHFCQYEIGDCDTLGVGQCVMKPEACDDDYTPVCGCDGVTYGNSCNAESAGVTIQHEGECDEPPTNDCTDCDEETHFCKYEVGDCDASGEGQCIMKPEMCTADYTPVCGCDGVTYGNACGAESAGINIDKEGLCDEPPSTNDCSDCDEETHFCKYETGDCDASGEGQCIMKPEMCTADYTPVCGCDGVTYGNACGAESAGVNIDKEGECDEPPTDDCSDCDEEAHFCKYQDGDCDASGEGQCMPKPEVCTDDYTPVCGCDGKTHSNACNAEAVGVSIDYQGECDEPPTDDCTDCDEDGYFCKYEDGDCGASGEGQCTRKPEVCTMDYRPVCGCDGKTHGNACGAESVGVSIDYQGECNVPTTAGCSECEGDDFVCIYPIGDCGTAAMGECTPRPEACPRIEAPVCGCDGVSYGNECVAISEGVSVAYEGDCVE